MAKTYTLDMTNDIAPSCTLTASIIGMRKWGFRKEIATRLMKLAARVINVGIKFEDQPWYGTDL